MYLYIYPLPTHLEFSKNSTRYLLSVDLLTSELYSTIKIESEVNSLGLNILGDNTDYEYSLNTGTNRRVNYTPSLEQLNTKINQLFKPEIISILDLHYNQETPKEYIQKLITSFNRLKLLNLYNEDMYL